MKIQFLELNNFKSFKGKCTISFNSGLTVITGLNGTGKSNIINGVNFALGKYETKTELIHEGEKEASVKIVLIDGMGIWYQFLKQLILMAKNHIYKWRIGKW